MRQLFTSTKVCSLPFFWQCAAHPVNPDPQKYVSSLRKIIKQTGLTSDYYVGVSSYWWEGRKAGYICHLEEKGVTWLQISTDTQEHEFSIARPCSIQEKPELWTWKFSIFKRLKKTIARLIKHIWELDPAYGPPGYNSSSERMQDSPRFERHWGVGLPIKSNGAWLQEQAFVKEYPLLASWLSIVIFFSIHLSIKRTSPNYLIKLFYKMQRHFFHQSVHSFIQWPFFEHLFWPRH